MSSFLAGWCGGLLSLVVGHPFETVKVRLQGSTLDYRKVNYRNSVDCALQIFRTDGVRGFYRGISAPLLVLGIANGALFFVFTSLQQYFTRMRSEQEVSVHDNLQNAGQLSVFENVVCASAGGCAYSVIMTPFEMVRIRMQTQDMFSHRKYNGSVNCARTLYREGGIGKLYRGFYATICRDVPGTVVWLGTYGLIRQMLPQETSRKNTCGALFAGGCAGVAQWIVVFPLDTIKTRRQIAHCGRFVDNLHVARDLWKTEGLPAFYYGIAPALCRAFIAHATMFVGVETVLRISALSANN